MKAIEILFVFITFSVVNLLFIADSSEVVIEFPSLATPSFELNVPDANFTELHELNFTDLSAGCGGFTDCIEFLGEVIRNIGEVFRVLVDLFFNFVEMWVFVALFLAAFVLMLFQVIVFLFDLIVFAFEIFVLLTTFLINPTTGVTDAPWFVNLLLFAPYTVAAGLILYKMVRKGSTND